MKKYKKYIVRDGYIGAFSHLDFGEFPVYLFPGGGSVADEQEMRHGFDTREEAEEYAMKEYGHAD